MTIQASPVAATRSCAQAYALCAASLLLILLVGAPLQLWSVPAGLTVTELMILAPAILFVRSKGISIRLGLSFHPVSRGIAVRSAMLGITAWGIAGALYYLVSCPLFGEPPNIDAMTPRSVPQWLLLILIGALLPGICEEALFRGAIFGVLQRKTPVKAVTISAFLFAVYHLSPWNLLPAFFLGALLGTLRTRTGSILPGVIAHACSNATAFTVAFLAGERENGSHAAIVLGVPSVLFAMAAWEFARHTKHFQPATSPLPGVPAALSRRFWLVVGGVVAFVMLLIVGVLLAYRIAVHTRELRSHKAAPKKVPESPQVPPFKTPGMKTMRHSTLDKSAILGRDSRKQACGKIDLLQSNAVQCRSPAMLPHVRRSLTELPSPFELGTTSIHPRACDPLGKQPAVCTALTRRAGYDRPHRR